MGPAGCPSGPIVSCASSILGVDGTLDGRGAGKGPSVSATILSGAGATFGASGVTPCFGFSSACFGAFLCGAGTAVAAPGGALCGTLLTALGRSADVGRLVIDVVGCVERHGIHSIATPAIAAAAAYVE